MTFQAIPCLKKAIYNPRYHFIKTIRINDKVCVVFVELLYLLIVISNNISFFQIKSSDFILYKKIYKFYFITVVKFKIPQWQDFKINIVKYFQIKIEHKYCLKHKNSNSLLMMLVLSSFWGELEWLFQTCSGVGEEKRWTKGSAKKR